MSRNLVLWICLLLFGITSERASGQKPPNPASVSGSVQARKALAAGQAEEALKLVSPVLAARPADEEATGVKVDALVALHRRDEAVQAYDEWFTATRRESPALLRKLARAEIEALSADDSAATQAEALEALVDAGVVEARTSLEKLAWATPPTEKSWPAIQALARLKDARASERVVTAVRDSVGSRKVAALTALASTGSTNAEAVLREALGSPDTAIMAAAADAAGALGLKALIPELRALAARKERYATFAAALALARLGDAGGQQTLKTALESDVPDIRLRAAAALSATPEPRWTERIRPLLADPDGLNRFQAAELLLPVDWKAAADVLTKGLTDPNPAVRSESARILSAEKQTPPTLLRQMLRDSAPRVRLLGARALLERSPADTPRGLGRGADQ
jgi:HEAT repeat protein